MGWLLVPTFSSTISRLNLLSRPLFLKPTNTIRGLRFLQLQPLKPQFFSYSPLGSFKSSSSPANMSTSFFTSPKPQTENPTATTCSDDDDDGLVILGIETSCDDTAAAVVSMGNAFRILKIYKA